MTRVLVVEDDERLASAPAINLKARTYDVDAADDAAAALRLAATGQADVILPDLGLPDMDGIDLIRALRGWNRLRCSCCPPAAGPGTGSVRWTRVRTTT